MKTKKTTPTLREYEALKAILDEIRGGGAPPTRARIGVLMGTAADKIAFALDGLEAKGLARPLYNAGPWVPMKDLEGRPVKVRCAVEIQEVTP